MSRNKAPRRKLSFDSVLENKKIVFLISLMIAVICWGAVSIVNTKEEERTITGVKVQLTQTEEPFDKYGLSVFDQTDFFIDVTLKGYSYLLRDITSDNIELTASCSSVAAAGTYDLSVTSALSGNVNNNVKITKLSAGSIKVYFDKEVEKTFNIIEDIEEKSGYAIAEGYVRENPILSAETVSISGASRDVNKIVSVKAHVVLNKTLSSTERLEAELVLESDSGTLDPADFTIHTDEPIYITIPVNHTGTYDAVVEFTNMPQYYKSHGFDYTVSPSTVDMTSTTSVDAEQMRSHQISIGTVDFSEIEPERVNTISLIFDSGNGDITYEVRIDATGYDGTSVTVPVDTSNITIPSNIRVRSTELELVTVAGPEESLAKIDKTAVYAVPVLDGLSSLTPGQYSIPAKIVFRTATDCWAYGKYTLDITVQ